MASVLVFGNEGQLASEIKRLRGNDPSYAFVPRTSIDIRQEPNLKSLIEKHDPQTIINCFAYTAVDKAESDQAACWALNADFPKRLAELCAISERHLIHYSTDYVFSGQSREPYSETDLAEPISAYGRSKLDGEIAIQKAKGLATIIRTSWLYANVGNNFVKKMLLLADSAKPLRVVNDQFGCPTWTRDLATFTVDHLVPRRAHSVETFNYSNEGHTNWFEFAQEIFKLWDRQKAVTPIPTSEYPTPAMRPAYGVLSKDKVKNDFGIVIPDWQTSLRRCRMEWEN